MKRVQVLNPKVTALGVAGQGRVWYFGAIVFLFRFESKNPDAVWTFCSWKMWDTSHILKIQ
jgi:hypothetical protein